jgi:hypothetical protein
LKRVPQTTRAESKADCKRHDGQPDELVGLEVLKHLIGFKRLRQEFLARFATSVSSVSLSLVAPQAATEMQGSTSEVKVDYSLSSVPFRSLSMAAISRSTQHLEELLQSILKQSCKLIMGRMSALELGLFSAEKKAPVEASSAIDLASSDEGFVVPPKCMSAHARTFADMLSTIADYEKELYAETNSQLSLLPICHEAIACRYVVACVIRMETNWLLAQKARINASSVKSEQDLEQQAHLFLAQDLKTFAEHGGTAGAFKIAEIPLVVFAARSSKRQVSTAGAHVAGRSSSSKAAADASKVRLVDSVSSRLEECLADPAMLTTEERQRIIAWVSSHV